MRSKFLLLAVSLASFAPKTYAQLPIVDIGMVPLENGQLEVRLRPDAFFDGLISSMTVTIRRDEASVATVSDFTTASPWEDHINLNFSESITDGGYIYDLYVGFGFSPLFTADLSWEADQEIVMGHFTVDNGPGTFQIVQDCPPNSQGDYFVSLNSEDRTGVVYQISTSTEDRSNDTPGVHISPNPSSGAARLSIDPGNQEQVAVQVLDAAGRMVQQLAIAVGSSNLVLDPNSLPAGSYHIRVNGSTFSRTIPWIVQHQ